MAGSSAANKWGRGRANAVHWVAVGSARNLKLRAQLGLFSGLLMSGFFLYFDITQPLGVAAGITYVAVVAIGLVAQSRGLVVLFGALGTTLTVLGYFASHPASNVSLNVIVLNRGLSLFALLTISITGYVLIQRQERFDARLIELASIDALTGLLNRRVLMDEAERRVEEARRYGQSLSVLMLDIDKFKKVNDRHGHLEGDQVLKAVARVMTRCSRRTDYLGRYGGEEFMLVCPNTDAEEAGILAERIRSSMQDPEADGRLLKNKLTVSIGVAAMAGPETKIENVIGAADQALYQAKNAGRNRVVIGPGGDRPLLEGAR